MQGDEITVNDLEVAVELDDVKPLVLPLLIERAHVGGASIIDLAGLADKLAVVDVANSSCLPGTSFQKSGRGSGLQDLSGHRQLGATTD